MENNTTHNDTAHPLGLWLRAVDHLIAREFATAFENEDVTRREWMILNVLDGTIEAPELAARIQRGGKRLRALEDRGWITEEGGSFTLTDDGRAAKARLSEAADAVRVKVAGAVSPEDFATTVASLEAIARSLGWDENEQMPRGRRHGFGRRGFGPGFHHGFGPRFVPGGHGFEGHEGDGHEGPAGDGHGAPEFGRDCGHGHAGHYGHGHPGHAGHRAHGGHPGHRGGHDAEQAYERGFDAGFARGAASHTA